MSSSSSSRPSSDPEPQDAKKPDQEAPRAADSSKGHSRNRGDTWMSQEVAEPTHWDELVQAEQAKFSKIFENNKKWVDSMLRSDPNYFKNLAAQPQAPSYLFIGCSDSRVPANLITGLPQGEMFVHRNIANLVVNTDINLLSVLQFAVETLQVKHIIVCGHYGCGGVKASLAHTDYGLLENWLRNIRDVQRLHDEELSKLNDETERWNKLVELNVYEQCINLFKTSSVQRARAKTGGRFPRVHGLVYNIAEGLLRELNVDYKGFQVKYDHIYRLNSRKDDDNRGSDRSTGSSCNCHKDKH